MKYAIALSLLPNIGSVLAKRLIAYAGSAEAVFKEKKNFLRKIPGIGDMIYRKISKKDALERAEKEILFIEKNNIQVLFYLDKDYPKKLRECDDCPVIMYKKGNASLDNQRMISIVGTRHITEYGRQFCCNLIRDLAARDYEVSIVSGLAYGIDYTAHKAAVEHNLPTIAVLGHGLSTIYPGNHASLAQRMLNNGALLSEFVSTEQMIPSNFVMRNRIIAGLSNATIVVESARRGGALITAEYANSYNRDVFALPGRAGDQYSEGCNRIIKQNKALLIENIDDLEYIMGWNAEGKTPVQKQLFIHISDRGRKIIELLKQENEQSLDIICLKTELPIGVVSSELLGLEFSGAVKSMPGKIYKLADNVCVD